MRALYRYVYFRGRKLNDGNDCDSRDLAAAAILSAFRNGAKTDTDEDKRKVYNAKNKTVCRQFRTKASSQVPCHNPEGLTSRRSIIPMK
jgi:hypothetical protein